MDELMARKPLITIFNGRRRVLGGGGGQDVYIQMYVALREYLHLFTSSGWKVLCAIAFHIDEDGWAWPGRDLLAAETGLHVDTVRVALNSLEEMRIEGQRVLLRYQPRDGERPIAVSGQGGGGKFNSSHYLIFPSAEECARFDGAGVKHLGAASGGGFRREPSLEKPTTVEPTTVEPTSEEPATNNNHVEQEPHGGGDIWELLRSCGVRKNQTVRGLVGRYTFDEVRAVVDAVSKEKAGNPAGLVVSMLKAGEIPVNGGGQAYCVECYAALLDHERCGLCGRCGRCCGCSDG